MSTNWNSVPKQQKVAEIDRLGQGNHSEQKSGQVGIMNMEAQKPLSASNPIFASEGEIPGRMSTNAETDESRCFIMEPKWLGTGHYQISLMTKLPVEGDK